jgi:hypothetical protein
MLLINEVYQLLLDELRVDKRGLSCGIDEFNGIAKMANYELYTDYLKRFEKDLDSIDTLGWFKTYNYGIDLTAGVGTMPSNYHQLIGKPRILVVADYIPVDLVTEYEHGCRSTDYLTMASVANPYCRIGGINATEELQIRVNPTTVTKVWIDYLRELNTPYLDYYINDTNYVKTFFAETTTAQAVPTGCTAPAVVINGTTYRNVTTGGAAVTVTSYTSNFDWGNDELSLLITKLVNRVAKQLPDELLLQTSSAEQAKSDNE